MLRKLRLVGAKTYSGPLVGKRVLTKGETFDFQDKDVPRLLEESSFDASNNEHMLFEEAESKSVLPGKRVSRSRGPVSEAARA